jgi:hypothetical protein
LSKPLEPIYEARSSINAFDAHWRSFIPRNQNPGLIPSCRASPARILHLTTEFSSDDGISARHLWPSRDGCWGCGLALPPMRVVDLVTTAVCSKSSSPVSALRRNSLRFRTGNLFWPNRESNRAIREFIQPDQGIPRWPPFHFRSSKIRVSEGSISELLLSSFASGSRRPP